MEKLGFLTQATGNCKNVVCPLVTLTWLHLCR